MNKHLLMIIAALLFSNFLYSQTFTKEEKEVFYKDYMKELDMTCNNCSFDDKEEYCYYFFRELSKVDKKEYDNMLDFERKILLKKLKKTATEIYEYNIFTAMVKSKERQKM